MSILSLSLQGDTAEQIAACEREIATYERDSGKVLDDEIKIGTLLVRLPELQLKTHLLMLFDTLKNEQSSGAKLLRSLRLRWTLEQARAARERKVVANVTIKRSKHVQDAEAQITLQQTSRRAENVAKRGG